MKRSILYLSALSLIIIGAFACSSKKKVSDVSELKPPVVAQPVQEQALTPPPPQAPVSSQPSQMEGTKRVASLGASSSGRSR